MKKLSEIENGKYVFVGETLDTILTVGEYLKERNWHKNESLYVADKVVAKITLLQILEYAEDEMHDEWVDDRMHEFSDNEEVKNAIGVINKIFENNPTYYKGERIIDDMST